MCTGRRRGSRRGQGWKWRSKGPQHRADTLKPAGGWDSSGGSLKATRAGCQLLEMTQPFGLLRPPLSPSDTQPPSPCGCWLQILLVPRNRFFHCRVLPALILWPGPQKEGSLCDLGQCSSFSLFPSPFLPPSLSILPSSNLWNGGHWTREPHQLQHSLSLKDAACWSGNWARFSPGVNKGLVGCLGLHSPGPCTGKTRPVRDQGRELTRAGLVA